MRELPRRSDLVVHQTTSHNLCMLQLTREPIGNIPENEIKLRAWEAMTRGIIDRLMLVQRSGSVNSIHGVVKELIADLMEG